MEAIKNAIGLGSTTTEQGREPVSGVAGSGVAGEPYDQGNADSNTLGGKAAQHTDPTTDPSTNPSTTSSTGPYTIGSGLGSNNSTPAGGVTSSQGVTPNTASATTSTGPAADPTSINTTGVPPHNSDLANKADTGVESSSTGEVRSSQGVIPNAASVTSTTGPATDPTSTNTTAGPHSSDIANKADPRVDSDSGSSAPGATATGHDTDPMHAHQNIPTSTVGGNDRTSTGAAPSHSLAASRASVAPLEKPDHDNAPLKPAERGGQHGSNPSAIPVAGGKKIGEDAYTERKSVQLDSAPSTGGAGLGGETSANTARNADPTSTSTTTGTPGTSTVGTSSAGEKESVSSGHSESKEKKSLKEKIKEKVHIH